MNIDEMYPSKYLKATDLGNKSTTAEIEEVVYTEVGANQEKRPVVRFKGKQKMFILNKTNARAIGDLYGKETAGWRGKRITLYPTSTEYAGKDMACIRIKEPRDFTRPEVSAAEPPAWMEEPDGQTTLVDDDAEF